MRTIKFRAWNKETEKFELPLYRGAANLNINDILCGSTLIYQQFTGLKDKNGKEIYENDIISIPDGYCGDHRIYQHNSEIVWDEDGWYTKDLTDEGYRYVEVIGNIYENKDLLK